MAVDIKFCGLTRAEDARRAVALGASYVGVIFASGPRMLSPEGAAAVFAEVPTTVRRVGVFADQSAEEIVRVAGLASLTVVQLHGTSDAARIVAVRQHFQGDIWAVLRVAGTALPAGAEALIAASDGLLLDSYVAGTLGGTGVALPWIELSTAIGHVRGNKTIVLAGGLTAKNVASAIAALAPDVVDVSSGVESEPGIKDHERMRAFRDAVTNASISI